MMSKTEIQGFASANRMAIEFLNSAADDYVSARCCILNGLIAGFPIASQAIEKALKALILFETRARELPKKLRRHTTADLKSYICNKLQKHGQILGLFDQLFADLYQNYLHRYPDNEPDKHSWSSNEIHLIDLCWCELMELLPVPDEVKFRTLYLDMVCNPIRKNSTFCHWLTVENRALEKKMPEFMVRYRNVMDSAQ